MSNQIKQRSSLMNYKGIYHDKVEEKYTCPETGAHFKFRQMCALLDRIRVERGDPACLQLPPEQCRQPPPEPEQTQQSQVKFRIVRKKTSVKDGSKPLADQSDSHSRNGSLQVSKSQVLQKQSCSVKQSDSKAPQSFVVAPFNKQASFNSGVLPKQNSIASDEGIVDLKPTTAKATKAVIYNQHRPLFVQQQQPSSDPSDQATSGSSKPGKKLMKDNHTKSMSNFLQDTFNDSLPPIATKQQEQNKYHTFLSQNDTQQHKRDTSLPLQQTKPIVQQDSKPLKQKSNRSHLSRGSTPSSQQKSRNAKLTQPVLTYGALPPMLKTQASAAQLQGTKKSRIDFQQKLKNILNPRASQAPQGDKMPSIFASETPQATKGKAQNRSSSQQTLKQSLQGMISRLMIRK